jgi:hypothetical protein
MSLFYFLGMVAAVFAFLGYILYVISIYKEKTIPSRMTWAILSGLSIVVLISNYELEAVETIGMFLVSAIGSTIIFFLSIRRGTGGWNRNDKVAFFGLLLSVIFWFIINDPLIALIIALSFDLWALYPTIMKVQIYPETEESLPWIFTVTASFMNVLALDISDIDSLRFEVAISPIYFFAINSIVLFFILKPFLRRL